jgi:hypothetical protein
MEHDANSTDWAYHAASISISILTTAAVTVLVLLLGVLVDQGLAVDTMRNGSVNVVVVSLTTAVVVAPVVLGIRSVARRYLTEKQTWGLLAGGVGVIVPLGFFLWLFTSEFMLHFEEVGIPPSGWFINSVILLILLLTWGLPAMVIVVGGPYSGMKLRKKLS